jgi:hypothetical protein
VLDRVDEEALNAIVVLRKYYKSAFLILDPGQSRCHGEVKNRDADTSDIGHATNVVIRLWYRGQLRAAYNFPNFKYVDPIQLLIVEAE